ncbi:MAG TPA: hypothetical protein VFT29_14465 [Gemmatimonadaceae bacterium]|nr:hypothetical protein [Gemmatimonadaceae bacterium]
MIDALAWFAFLFAVGATYIGLRMEGNWLVVLPVFITAVPLAIRRRAPGIVAAVISTVLLAAFTYVATFSIGRYLLPSLMGTVIGVAVRIAQRQRGA